jgi:AraC-like DNA-binding protein
MPPNKYLNRFRIEQAKKQMLENPSNSITQVAMDAGFSSQAYFSRVFRKEAGISPKEFRAKNNL